MYLPELSDSMSVDLAFVTTPCACVTCQHNMQVTLQTTVIIADDEVFDFRTPKRNEFSCTNCGSHYVKWGVVKATNNK